MSDQKVPGNDINLDTLAQKRASRRKQPKFIFKTTTYTLKKELPYTLFRDLEAAVREEDVRDIALLDTMLRALLGDGSPGSQYEQFMAADPSLDDINDLFDNLGSQYGVKVGESQPS